jgi:hypothetical protein
MQKSKSKILIAGTVSVIFIFVIFLFSFLSNSYVQAFTPGVIESPIAAENLTELICLGTGFLSKVLMPPLAIILILWAGILYLTASGRPEMIKNAHTVLISVVFGVAILLLAPALVALAVNVAGTPSGAPVGVDISDVCSVNAAAASITASLINLINWFSWFIAAVSIAMGMYSGFLFMTSQGDPEKSKKATTAIIFTLVGIAVSILAFSVISIVEIFIK